MNIISLSKDKDSTEMLLGDIMVYEVWRKDMFWYAGCMVGEKYRGKFWASQFCSKSEAVKALPSVIQKVLDKVEV